MTKPIIGITGNERPHPDTTIARLSYTSDGFIRAVEKVGGLPLVLPIVDKSLAAAYVDTIDKLILTGGQNVLPQFYGEEQTIDSDDYLLERDEFEIALIKETLKQGKPIFAICRGTQLFNVVKGGTLHQDIPGHWQSEDANTLTQSLAVEQNSLLAKFVPTGSCINSYHHQALKDLGKDLRVVAYDPKDGIIEAIESTDNYPFIGVQWHPELIWEHEEPSLALFDFFVNQLQRSSVSSR
ncbi:gamma-glutamyl-gamma-aminobutyrate hydrolase family protein [Streptococcus massiliensis]|uniref:Glutamine amidotransferase, class I n=1 Tax=Streptococcus massiliensis TaxID=313439 RepID=A0A380KVR2_9STRE|nr:gamma-glutamyl-gamma-aminobutyrate hydrolase family protein [Streptococcus massiliensis]SUN76002.1 glutamine amidotransferase, class I [Streptococcus massiliensis]